MSSRLAVFATHPIQYLAPIWRQLAQEPEVRLRVHFFSDCSLRGEVDPGFGVPVAWDVPLVAGYDHVFLDRRADRSNYRRTRIPDPEALLARDGFEWVMVHGYVHRFERQAVRAARRLGLRTLLRGELTDRPRPGRPSGIRWLRRLYLRWFYGHVDAFCYLGKNGRDHLLAHNVAEEKIFFSPATVDDAFFAAQRRRSSRSEARTALGIGQQDLAVIFCGKLIARKAPGLLIDAIGRLAAPDRVHLIVLGDGPLRGDVEAAARAVVGRRLTMPGFVNQAGLGRYYGAADVFVLPSEYETWGLVVNEAMHFGLPVVVSSAVGCHPDLVIPERTGMVFASGDAAALARCLETLAADPGGRAAMGERAREQVGGYTTAAAVRGIVAALRPSVAAHAYSAVSSLSSRRISS